MRKLFNLLEYMLWSGLRRRKKLLALVAIYAIVVAFFASVVLLTASLKQEAAQVLEGLPSIWVQKLQGGRLVPLDTSFVAEVQGIRGVKIVYPRIWGYLFDTPTGAVFTVASAAAAPTDISLLGTIPEGGLDSLYVLAGTGFLALRGLEVGDRMTIADSDGRLQSFTIAAAFEAQTDLLTRDLLIFSPNTARKLLGMKPNEVTDVALEVFNPEEVENIGQKIDRANRGVRVVTLAELKATYEALFSWRGGIFLYGSLISVMAFLILAWDRAAGLSGEERRELGILKGIGWGIGDILWFKFFEGLFISLSATLLGLLLAYIHVFILQAPLLKPFFIGWSVMYPAYQLEPFFTLGDLLTVVFIAVVPYISATLVPAWAGAITDPAEIIRS